MFVCVSVCTDMVHLYNVFLYRLWEGFITIFGECTNTLLREIAPKKNYPPSKFKKKLLLFKTGIKMEKSTGFKIGCAKSDSTRVLWMC